MILGEPIILGGGGGIVCVAIITTEPSAVVTATFGNESISKTANVDGKAVFELKKAGVWTITASLNGETVFEEIDTNLSLETELRFVDPVLENNTWEEISEIARSGKASTIWNVGDTKKIKVGSVTYTAQIVDFDIYDVDDPTSYGREKAGIVFQYVELVDDKQGWSKAKSNADSEITYNAECKDLIPTIKYEYATMYNASAIVVTGKGIFPSEPEIFGTNSYDTILTGKQYAFYAAGNKKIKYVYGYSSLLGGWWLRSTAKTGTYRCIVKTDGTLSRDTGSVYYAPVFCL